MLASFYLLSSRRFLFLVLRICKVFVIVAITFSFHLTFHIKAFLNPVIKNKRSFTFLRDILSRNIHYQFIFLLLKKGFKSFFAFQLLAKSFFVSKIQFTTKKNIHFSLCQLSCYINELILQVSSTNSTMKKLIEIFFKTD